MESEKSEEVEKTTELIETLWNVNYDEKSENLTVRKGINRNIVECKFFFLNNHSNIFLELIETLWNVNFFQH